MKSQAEITDDSAGQSGSTETILQVPAVFRPQAQTDPIKAEIQTSKVKLDPEAAQALMVRMGMVRTDTDTLKGIEQLGLSLVGAKAGGIVKGVNYITMQQALHLTQQLISMSVKADGTPNTKQIHRVADSWTKVSRAIANQGRVILEALPKPANQSANAGRTFPAGGVVNAKNVQVVHHHHNDPKLDQPEQSPEPAGPAE